MNTLACHNVGKYDVRWWFTSPSYLNKFTINAMRASNSFYLKDFKYGIDSNRTLERLIKSPFAFTAPVSYTHLRAHETRHDIVCRLLLEKKKKNNSE